MNRLLLIGLLLCCIVAWGCNKPADEKSTATNDGSGSQTLAASGESALKVESVAGTQDIQSIEIASDGTANEEYVALVMEIAPAFGITYEDEKDMLYTTEGHPLGSPADVANRVDLVLLPAANTGITEPREAVHFILEELVRPMDEVQAETSPQQPQEPQEPVEPVVEELDLSGMNTKEMTIALASDFSLVYDSSRETLTGSGFPSGGISVGTIVSKIDLNLTQRGEDSDTEREAEVRKVLGQLVETGRQAAADEATSADKPNTGAGGGQQGRGRQPLDYNPDEGDLIHPAEVYGDWQSIREDHPSFQVDHNDDYFWDVQLRYRGNSIFRLHKDGELFSNKELPYSYDQRTGTLALLGADGKVEQTYIVWATERDPMLIWLQRESSKVRTLYQKVGTGGQPVSEEEFIAGLRELLGDEGVENYRKFKERQKQENE